MQPVKFQHLSYRTVGEGGGQTFIIEIVISDNVDNIMDIPKCKSPCFLSPPVQLARWAHMHRFLSVVCSLDLTKKGGNNSYLRKYLLLTTL